ncbi:hypothetical protein HBI56_174830 [Parastagonospora nodorum]|nr:hypothetical protein HBI09_158220 [Parastagonospora nodorum]KAH4341824.1 hypothetical protein HBH98_170430 [Parastagonospora nodorum]KAH4366497.1 hypothetical protein HBH97_164770 [Parastagonospora nodorum]KAH4389361.1 hypothetical protein HBH99_163600 [Parastagonospora nodorum]KAH4899479.1 hypothetical protein HBI80_167690 [Parastagonospora nodorum]
MMAESATITFSQTGVQPPVYVVTSLSDPPWEPLEMHVDEAQTASANLIFTRRFDNVAEGDHQYKIRIGDGHWVVDESRDSATDEHGNRNNVLHVTAAKQNDDQNTARDVPHEHEKPPFPQKSRKDSTFDTSDVIHLPSVPVPIVVVEKVADEEPPINGDTEPRALHEDVSKHSADAQPDFQTTREERSATDEQAKLSDRPRVVVEKTDDKPAYGDDFGANATISQRVAHDMRAADAKPNMLVITPDGHEEPRTEDDQAAPLFRHESFQSSEAHSSPVLETVDEVSTDNTSSEDVINTPSDPDDSQGSELDQAPLLSHETGIKDKDYDELNNGPLLPHETGLNEDMHSSDEDYDELDAAPLLSHETGFSQYKGSEISTKSEYTSEDISEPRHYMYGDDNDDYDDDEVPTFTHEDGGDDDHVYREDDTPLLAHERTHERDFATTENSSPEEGGGFTLKSQPTFEYEDAGESARVLFGGRGRPGIFRASTNSSTLPNRLPKTDEEDDDLADPYLERFPTRREQILERVKTIGLHLPEDESTEEPTHSPIGSVLSQACSSVELAPVKSYTSLASVPEADDSDEEEYDADGDVDSLPSPMVMKFGSAAAFARDPHATPMPNDSRQLEPTEDGTQQSSIDCSMQSSEADNVNRTDGTKEAILSKLHEAIASPSNMLNPITPPLTPENEALSIGDDESTTVSEPQVRQRQAPKAEAANATPEDHSQDASNTLEGAGTPSGNQKVAHYEESFLQTFFRVVFGSVGRFLAVCVGDRKRAGVTIAALCFAATAYHLLLA